MVEEKAGSTRDLRPYLILVVTWLGGLFVNAAAPRKFGTVEGSMQALTSLLQLSRLDAI